MYKHTDNTFLVCYIPFFSSFTTYRICNKFRKKQDGEPSKDFQPLVFTYVFYSLKNIHSKLKFAVQQDFVQL